jgi:hypothetical protein
MLLPLRNCVAHVLIYCGVSVAQSAPRGTSLPMAQRHASSAMEAPHLVQQQQGPQCVVSTSAADFAHSLFVA